MDPQLDFTGGMNLLSSDTKIQANEYGLAQNIRIRDDGIEAVKAPTIESSAPIGKKQGIFAYENFILLFNSGSAYYKNILNDAGWINITGFGLSPSVDYIYAEAVPVSKFNFDRKLQEPGRIDGSSTETNVNITAGIINNTEAGLVCQDGTSQPFLILPDGSSRPTQTYEQWTNSNREYVPVMSRMKYHSDILFGLAPDGITLLRSVSGRPLDFVVNVDTHGNKGGNASTTAYSAGVNAVTCLSSLKTGELFVGTKRSCHPIELNFDKTIFAEPTFLNRKTFQAGVVNQFSFIDIFTDYTMIDTDGIRSVNAIISENNEGRNSLFSRNISKALVGITQSIGAAIVFDNYAIYSINTIYGARLAVFDLLQQVWVCFDDLGIGLIKQFAIADQSTNPVLYAITETEVYTLYSNTSRAEAFITTKADTYGPSAGLTLAYVALTFDNNTTTDEIEVKQIADNVEFNSLTQSLTDVNVTNNIIVSFTGLTRLAKKVKAKIVWQNDGKLTELEVNTTPSTSPITGRQTANLFSA